MGHHPWQSPALRPCSPRREGQQGPGLGCPRSPTAHVGEGPSPLSSRPGRAPGGQLPGCQDKARGGGGTFPPGVCPCPHHPWRQRGCRPFPWDLNSRPRERRSLPLQGPQRPMSLGATVLGSPSQLLAESRPRCADRNAQTCVSGPFLSQGQQGPVCAAASCGGPRRVHLPVWGARQCERAGALLRQRLPWGGGPRSKGPPWGGIHLLQGGTTNAATFPELVTQFTYLPRFPFL